MAVVQQPGQGRMGSDLARLLLEPGHQMSIVPNQGTCELLRPDVLGLSLVLSRAEQQNDVSPRAFISPDGATRGAALFEAIRGGADPLGCSEAHQSTVYGIYLELCLGFEHGMERSKLGDAIARSAQVHVDR